MNKEQFAQALLNLMAQYYGRYELTSNWGKLALALSRQLEDLKTMLDDMFDIIDIDKASNSNLDIFLRNLNLTRGSNDDESVRNIIKTEILSNFSKGQIDTIKEVSELIFGESSFKGIGELWNDNNFNTQAGLLLKVSSNLENTLTLPEPTILKSVSGGVRVVYDVLDDDEIIEIIEDDATVIFHRNIFVRAGTVSAGQTSMGVLL